VEPPGEQEITLQGGQVDQLAQAEVPVQTEHRDGVGQQRRPGRLAGRAERADPLPGRTPHDRVGRHPAQPQIEPLSHWSLEPAYTNASRAPVLFRPCWTWVFDVDAVGSPARRRFLLARRAGKAPDSARVRRSTTAAAVGR
jgi:hypothetical protein